MRRAILFDDGRGQLSPLTDLRAAFDVRTGAMTTLERLRLAMGLNIEGLLVPAPLAALTGEAHPGVPINDLGNVPGDVLLINGRCALAYKEIGALQTGEAIVEAGSGDLVAMATSAATIRDLLAGAPVGSRQIEFAAPALLSRPWHVRTFRDAALGFDLATLGGAQVGAPPPSVQHATVITGSPAHPLHVHRTARVYPGVILDCEAGPIMIDEGAVLRPACTLIGPVYVGPHSTINDRAVIRGQTAIGPWCKVAGEVGGTIFQGYTNKAHDGYLGDSWVGEWCNFGAGTTNSNLLNTYGEVISRATPNGSNERTGQQFLGCIVGDHVKFAICTRIMTGSVVHTGAMWAAGSPVSGCVGAFSWVTDAGTKGFRLDKFNEVARAVMGRRKVEPSAAYVARVGEVHGRVE
jgi:UDP-N-acetylglucosamine diphosphorylase / glucose-1-phosphate thymidylyltransferase / UDP-N-acetylgalactosamine diphosphorylase / glucosamine-1-phosphate N-acetyltransferase / galactosamine-1-phosphate N-acetyltransferase